MRGISYNGIPTIKGKTPDQALEILYRHCDDMAQIVMRMNKEIEELKDEVEALRSR
jgi:prefoldin subunit 5